MLAAGTHVLRVWQAARQAYLGAARPPPLPVPPRATATTKKQSLGVPSSHPQSFQPLLRQEGLCWLLLALMLLLLLDLGQSSQSGEGLGLLWVVVVV